MALMFTDAHIHFMDLHGRDPGFIGRYAAGPYLACAASHDEAEFLATEALRGEGASFVASFGIHPQWPVWKNADFLAGLAAKGQIAIIGEAGFDFFGDRPERVRTRENEDQQTAVFEYQLALAERHGLPLLLHLRKAMDKAFAYSSRLARLPAVVFHSYSGTAREAADILARRVPAFFSFGGAIMNGHKRAIEACKTLPEDRLLSETDAPWQPPRGAEFCPFEAIVDIVAAMASLRGVDPSALEASLEDNFCRVYPAAESYRSPRDKE
jgi:TatD DNase family protein